VVGDPELNGYLVLLAGGIPIAAIACAFNTS
jgi:hypothetical protein